MWPQEQAFKLTENPLDSFISSQVRTHFLAHFKLAVFYAFSFDASVFGAFLLDDCLIDAFLCENDYLAPSHLTPYLFGAFLLEVFS